MHKISIMFLALTVICFSVANFANAEITVKDYMSINFLDKQGYSNDTLKIVETNKAKTFGELPPEPAYKNKLHKAYVLMMNYLDPSRDDGQFGNHQIKMHASPTGL